MKSIIEREVTFENNSDMEVKVTQEKIITSICKGNIMKQDMLNKIRKSMKDVRFETCTLYNLHSTHHN